jgi:hypothetical protein
MRPRNSCREIQPVNKGVNVSTLPQRPRPPPPLHPPAVHAFQLRPAPAKCVNFLRNRPFVARYELPSAASRADRSIGQWPTEGHFETEDHFKVRP